MADTTFASGTVIAADWLNDVNDAVYTTIANLPTVSTYAATLLDDVDANEAQTTLGATSTGKAVFTAVDATAARAAIGAVIGTNVQAYNASIATTNTSQTFTAQQVPFNGTLTDGATINWNGNTNGQVVAVTLTGNRTMAAPTNIQSRALYLMRVTQDATGSRTLTWNAAFKFGGSGAPTLTTTASKVDILSFVGGASNTLEFIGIRKNAV
jgi:hypothetical protein